MHKYSDFFKTLHDERSPAGYLGRGTHYSVLRAVVFPDAAGRALPRGHFADFAVIWDEDHDDRIIEPIEVIYHLGLLSFFVMFGERKGEFTAVLADGVKNPEQISVLQKQVAVITQQLGDAWGGHVVSLRSEKNTIIDASHKHVMLYLENVIMLWQLGLERRPIGSDRVTGDKRVKSLMSTRVETLLSSAHPLESNGIFYVGDLVQKNEAELLRMQDIDRKDIDQIKQELGVMGLHLGMEVPGWIPTTSTRCFGERREFASS